ncbi:Reverse transcriptase, RNA-dependent DNA polymerase [Salix suchowensis]|nr:Reverse transcriptase, RNA-dependent DNA polymerase [Salix suchowensis]
MTTPASSSSSVSVTSSNLPISLAALTNNFSTHLNADNYLLWRDQITPLLICNDLYGHIDGTDPPPPKTIINEGTISPNPDYARWFKIDQLVVGGIKNTLSSTACAEVLGKHVAKDVWDTLETLFHQQTLSRADILHDTLLDTYKNDMSIEAYLAKIKGIADQLAAISQPVPDSELVKRTLRGLPHTLEYQPFAQGIANRHTPISFTKLRARLLVHEQELERIRGRVAPPLASPSHHAFVTQQHHQPSHNTYHGNYRRPNRPRQGTVTHNFGGSSTASILGQYPNHTSPSFADHSNKSFNNNVPHGRNRFHTGNNYGNNFGNRPQFGRSRYRGRCQICKQ